MQIEGLYQAIGQLALENVAELSGKLVVYAEVQDGVVASGMFYERDEPHTVTFRFCSEELEDTLYALWERWQQVPGNKTWFGLSYVMQNGKLEIDLTYPDQIPADEGLLERRSRLVRKHFGQSKVDYSSPGG